MGRSASPEWSLPPLENIERLDLDRPLVCFDLETLGTNNDRIVEFGAVKVWPNGCIREFHWLINPGTPIAPRASAKHKAREEKLIKKPMFSAYADSIMEVFEGCDIMGYNSVQHDVPILQGMFRRLEKTKGYKSGSFKFPPEDARHIDVLTIFVALESSLESSSESSKAGLSASYSGASGSEFTGAPSCGDDVEDTADSSQNACPSFMAEQNHVFKRTAPHNYKLSTAFKFYTGGVLVNAHTALVDAGATLRVFLMQLERYSKKLPSTVQGLQDFCKEAIDSMATALGGPGVLEGGALGSSSKQEPGTPLATKAEGQQQNPQIDVDEVPCHSEESHLTTYHDSLRQSAQLSGTPLATKAKVQQQNPQIDADDVACHREESHLSKYLVSLHQSAQRSVQGQKRESFIVLVEGQYYFSRGKHGGRSLEYVEAKDPDYLDWMFRNRRKFDDFVNKIIRQYL